MEVRTKQTAEEFADTLKADDAALFLDLVKREEWEMIRGHFPAFLDGAWEEQKALTTSDVKVLTADDLAQVTHVALVDNAPDANCTTATGEAVAIGIVGNTIENVVVDEAPKADATATVGGVISSDTAKFTLTVGNTTVGGVISSDTALQQYENVLASASEEAPEAGTAAPTTTTANADLTNATQE